MCTFVYIVDARYLVFVSDGTSVAITFKIIDGIRGQWSGPRIIPATRHDGA